MVADIDEALLAIPKTKSFNVNDPGHVMLLMADLTDLFIAVKVGEYQEYLSKLGHEVALSDVKRYLFLLHKLGMVDCEPYGYHRYFCNLANSKHIKYSLTEEDAVFDRLRLRAEVIAYYSEHDKRRSAMIKARLR